MSNTETSKIEELEKVWTPEARWSDIPNVNAEFVFPAFGPANYNGVVKRVLASGQKLPTGRLSAFMLDEAYNSVNEKVKQSPRTEFVKQNIIYNGWLWVPVVNVWTPISDRDPGMYAVFDENGEGITKERSIVELKDRLGSAGGRIERGVRFSNDGKVAFAPRSTIKSGTHNKGTLAQDGAYIATYEVEGAEKLDKVANLFRFDPKSWIVENTTDKPIQSLSALGWGRVLNVSWLDANFYSDGSGRCGYVLSVSGSK